MTNRKKVLIITTISGFLHKFELRNVEMLQRLGYEVHYAANTKEKVYDYNDEEYERLGIIVHHVNISKSPFSLKQNREALKVITDIICREEIRLIHCHTPVGGVLGRLAGKHCRNQGVKVIYTAHGFHFYREGSKLKGIMYKVIEAFLAGYTDAIVLINREDYEAALKFRLRTGGKVYLIPGIGLDREKYHPMLPDEKMRLRHELGIGKNCYCMVSVGELNRNKNHLAVLDMLVLMKEKGIDLSGYRYVICGNGVLRDDIREKIRERKLENVVILYGYCKHPEDFVGMADVFFFPSRREGLGMAALEALAMGIPVIAADNRGTKEYMQSGQNGYVCAWNDTEAYYHRLMQIQALSMDEYRAMSARCRASVSRFDCSCTDQIMWEVYNEIDHTIEAGG